MPLCNNPASIYVLYNIDIINFCLGTFCPGTFYPGTFCPRTFYPGTFCPGTFCREHFVRDILSGDMCVWGHLYADDRGSVLYLHSLAFNVTATVRSMSQTSGTTTRLRINPSRTQFIW